MLPALKYRTSLDRQRVELINKKKTLVGSEDTKKSESRRFQEHSEKVLF